MNPDVGDPEVRLIRTAETIALRWQVLRPGKPQETAHFPGDDDAATRHFGIFQHGQLIGIASIFAAEARQMSSISALQLRGMAVAPEHQGTGLGGRLLRACVDHARKSGAQILWCNSRKSAAGFYRKHGFEIVSDQFDIPEVGPHFRMVLKL